MELPDFLTEMPVGEIRLSGHRIGLYHIVEDYNRGFSPQRLQEEFPSLSLELIHKVLEFYQANREAVDAYMTRCRAESERGRQQGKGFDIAKLQRRVPSRFGRS